MLPDKYVAARKAFENILNQQERHRRNVLDALNLAMEECRTILDDAVRKKEAEELEDMYHAWLESVEKTARPQVAENTSPQVLEETDHLRRTHHLH
jgi:hypothetical protein